MNWAGGCENLKYLSFLTSSGQNKNKTAYFWNLPPAGIYPAGSFGRRGKQIFPTQSDLFDSTQQIVPDPQHKSGHFAIAKSLHFYGGSLKVWIAD